MSFRFLIICLFCLLAFFVTLFWSKLISWYYHFEAVQYVGSRSQESTFPDLRNYLDPAVSWQPHDPENYLLGLRILSLDKDLPGLTGEKRLFVVKKVENLIDQSLQNLCESGKVSLISNLTLEQAETLVASRTGMWNQLKNPCQSYDFLIAGAYLTTEILKQNELGRKLYRLASFQEGLPEGRRNMEKKITNY